MVTACHIYILVLYALATVVGLVGATVQHTITPGRDPAFLLSVPSTRLLQFVSGEEGYIVLLVVGEDCWCIGVLPLDTQLVLLYQLVDHFPLALGLRATGLDPLLNICELPLDSKVQIPEEPSIVAFLDLHLILHADFVLLEALLVDLDEVIDSLLGLGIASSEMCTDEAETGLEDANSQHHCTLVAELSTHPRLDGVLLH